MITPVVLAIDVGTSSARASLFDARGEPVAGRFAHAPYEPRTTADGGVEHDPGALLAAVASCIDAVHATDAVEVRGVGITTFWHGLVGFDAEARPLTPVYTWADTRSTEDADRLRATVDERALHARTGCHLHPAYWPAKLRWLGRAQPALVQRVARWGAFGEHLERELFGEAATSVSMASGTGLLEQATCAWDAQALTLAGVTPAELFPLVDRDDARRGLREPWAARWPRLRTVPWFPAIGDGVASNVGSDCTDASRIALNVGTSAALRVVSRGALPTTPGLWRYRVDRATAITGGATSEGGNVYAWCRDTLKLPDEAAVERALAVADADAHRLTVLPFLAGERSPGWRGGRRAVIAGLALDTTPVQILHAALEAVALRLALVYDLLAPTADTDHLIVASGGGVAHSAAWRQILADAIGRPLHWHPESEATSRGVALLTLGALGMRRGAAATPTPLGEAVVPDPARHARYRGALARQRMLDEKV